jgi:hypothetical protein
MHQVKLVLAGHNVRKAFDCLIYAAILLHSSPIQVLFEMTVQHGTVKGVDGFLECSPISLIYVYKGKD